MMESWLDQIEEKEYQAKNNVIIDSSEFKFKEEEELKNIRLRYDGRWEFRKVVSGERISIIARTQRELLQKIKSSIVVPRITYNKKTKSFYELAVEWFTLFKKDKIVGDKAYEYYINGNFNTPLFNNDISKLQLENLQRFLNKLSDTHRKAKYCYNIIKNVFKYALQKDLIKKDISQFLQSPKNKGEKGSAFSLSEQKLILQNLDKTPIKHEILFYLLTGARREEAIKTKLKHINFEKNMIFINGTKTKTSKRWVPISETFKNILKENFDSMFKHNKEHYTKEFSKYLELLGIENKKLHDCRHTFSTNLFYMGVSDKQRQSYLGHSSIVITNDIYTTLDPTITKEDIFKLYNNLYPNFN